MDMRDRFRGCLIGGAAGDALGYPVEFEKRSAIKAKYGAAGITEYALFQGFDKALVTDDTQMTMFTANGLLRFAALRQSGQPAEYTDCIRQAYREWLYTQQHPSAPHPFRNNQPEGEWQPPAQYDAWLMEVPWLYGRRAPGNTCLTAIAGDRQGTMQRPVNQSKGCGGIMRTAPAGLFAGSPEDAMRIGAEAAALTHGHPLGYIPAGVFSYLVYEAAHTDHRLEKIVLQALSAADCMFRQMPAVKDELPLFRCLIEQAVEYAADCDADEDEAAMEALGEGWVGEEALAVAVYCALRYEDDFTRCLCAAVNHDGDSDSTGAIAGNLLGARIGLSGIPARWTEKLEGVPELTRLANDLYDIAQHDAAWEARYLRAERN